MFVSAFCTSGSGERTSRRNGESNRRGRGIVVQSDPSNRQHSGVESAPLVFHIHQDRACVKLLDMLDKTPVMFVQDWAMKYLPRKYRKSQTDRFCKRGIPWHISFAFRKRNEQIELLTFCHIFKSCTQDSSAVLAVMAKVIEQLKSAMLGMDTVFYRQDNAGCYHCGASIVCTSTIGRQQGVAIRHLNFSNAQGGKGVRG